MKVDKNVGGMLVRIDNPQFAFERKYYPLPPKKIIHNIRNLNW